MDQSIQEAQGEIREIAVHLSGVPEYRMRADMLQADEWEENGVLKHVLNILSSLNYIIDNRAVLLKMENLSETVSNLWAWLQTWHDESTRRLDMKSGLRYLLDCVIISLTLTFILCMLIGTPIMRISLSL